MSAFIRFLTEHASLGKQLPYGHNHDRSRGLVKTDNGLLLATEIYSDIGEGAKIIVQTKNDSMALATSPLVHNVGLTELAIGINVPEGYLDLDTFMRREASRSCSKADLLDRVEDLFLGITDWEDPEKILDNVEVSVGFEGYELNVFGTCLWLEDRPSPTIQLWMKPSIR